MSYLYYKTIANQISELFKKMDLENDNFSNISGLKCVSTCNGKCCTNKNVEVSPIDLIPLVVSLIESDEIDDAILLAKEKEDEHCLFFKMGRCSKYSNRPTLCRLFGVSSIYNKHKEKVLSTCSLIKEDTSFKDPCPVIKNTAPNLVDWSQRVRNLLPHWEQSTLPFNKALLYAADRIQLTRQYE